MSEVETYHPCLFPLACTKDRTVTQRGCNSRSMFSKLSNFPKFGNGQAATSWCLSISKFGTYKFGKFGKYSKFETYKFGKFGKYSKLIMPEVETYHPCLFPLACTKDRTVTQRGCNSRSMFSKLSNFPKFGNGQAATSWCLSISKFGTYKFGKFENFPNFPTFFR